MSKINAPRGTEDILPSQSWKWQIIEQIARDLAELYHFSEIRTPTFEHTQLYHRGVGETTDIVSKETFTFEDRGGDSMTLRPEGTAGVVRAAIENSLIAQEGSRAKLYYIGPNFRYERPAKGRLREHHQFGVETLGIASPEADVECILLQMEFYRLCGIKDLELQINSLGDRDSKSRYRDKLVEYMTPFAAQLSEDSQRRLGQNPFRILDSKDPRDQQACENAPPALESLSERSRGHFDRVEQLLKDARVVFRVNQRLVRGFDYYTDTLWEVTASGLGSQNALGGGGRYDNLVEQLGGKPTPGVGFGSGLERLLIALEGQGVELKSKQKPLVWLISQGDAARAAQWNLLLELRAAGIAADMEPSARSMKAQLTIANREKAAVCVVVGESELAGGLVQIKPMQGGNPKEVPRSEAVESVRAAILS